MKLTWTLEERRRRRRRRKRRDAHTHTQMAACPHTHTWQPDLQEPLVVPDQCLLEALAQARTARLFNSDEVDLDIEVMLATPWCLAQSANISSS
jgi:hypothetical protein